MKAELKVGETWYKLHKGILGDSKGLKLLDAGCGKSSILGMFHGHLGIGCDIIPETINKDIDKFVNCSLEETPFDSNYFDLVTTSDVIEHLESPLKVFREIHRILKPKGYFIFKTVNLLNYAMIISALTPLRFHALIRRFAFGDEKANNVRTYYCANLPWRLRSMLKGIGFQGQSFFLGGAYDYLRFSKILYSLASFGNRLTRYFIFYPFRLFIIGVYRK